MPNPQTKFQTSFVPKKPVVSGPGIPTPKGNNFFMIIATFIFIVSLVFVGLVYFWKYSLTETISGQLNDLQRARDEFNPEEIAQATRLNNRIISIEELLNKHRSPVQVFEVLERYTLNTVRFNSFSYKTTEGNEISISGSGVGSGFESIVLQSDEFGATTLLRDVIFNSVVGQENGLVSFSFSALLDPNVVLYRKSLNNN